MPGAGVLNEQVAALAFVHNVHNTIRMATAYVSARVEPSVERMVVGQARAAGTSKSDLVARYVTEKSVEAAFPGVSFRDAQSGREAFMTGRRVAVWEVEQVQRETKSVRKTAEHFGWPSLLVRRALAYAAAYPDAVRASREGESHAPKVAG